MVSGYARSIGPVVPHQAVFRWCTTDSIRQVTLIRPLRVHLPLRGRLFQVVPPCKVVPRQQSLPRGGRCPSAHTGADEGHLLQAPRRVPTHRPPLPKQRKGTTVWPCPSRNVVVSLHQLTLCINSNSLIFVTSGFNRDDNVLYIDRIREGNI